LASIVDTYPELRAAAASRECRSWLETGRILVCTRKKSRLTGNVSVWRC